MLPSYIKKAIELLEKSGYEVWLVGGCVRDRCMNIPPHDYDLTTNATPSQMQTVFTDYRLLLNGVAHGTVTPLIEHQPIEITTYRTETTYSDHRRPDEVAFAKTIEEDLSRRDFTVNAMAFHPKRGILDPFDGQGDIKRRVIRAVGEPIKRFEEDALRILRALRFAVRFSFAIEEKTAQAMLLSSPTLSFVAKERITEELRGILGVADCEPYIDRFAEVFSAILPNFKATALDGELDFLLRLVKLSYASGCDFGEALCLTKTERKRLTRLLSLYDLPLPKTENEVRLFAVRYGVEDARDLFLLHGCKEAGGVLKRCLEDKECLTLAQLAVKGKDLPVKGERIGEALQALLEAVALKKAENEREALLNYVKDAIL